MKHIIWLLVALLIIFHQDFWFWDEKRLVMGFMPIGLFYHVCLSIAAAAVWLLACTFAWPKGVDEFDELPSEVSSSKGTDA